jgi:hypothetical protein
MPQITKTFLTEPNTVFPLTFERILVLCSALYAALFQSFILPSSRSMFAELRRGDDVCVSVSVRGIEQLFHPSFPLVSFQMLLSFFLPSFIIRALGLSALPQS